MARQRVYFGQDDTLLRKASRKIPGTPYARDPLSPPFQVNLVLGQRFVQTSLLVQPGGAEHPWRALPVSFSHAPTPKIPKRASPEEQAALKEVRKKHRLSLVALEQLQFCRQFLDRQPGGRQRWLSDVVDGGYSNRTFLARDCPNERRRWRGCAKTPSSEPTCRPTNARARANTVRTCPPLWSICKIPTCPGRA